MTGLPPTETEKGEVPSAESVEGPDKGKSRKAPSRKRQAVKRTLLIGLAFIAGFIILGVIAIQVWEYSNSVSFCTNACHDVHPEEPASYADSYHAQVKCTECHMGRLGTIRSLVLKSSHFRHLPEVILKKYERPLESKTMRPPNESCERCHFPKSFHGDTVREVSRFRPDERNTEAQTYLILKTAGGAQERGLGYGIHWHIVNKVEYIPTDETKQEIRWVRTTLPDGPTVEYNDVTNPLTAEQIATAEKKTMDCVDCHNRIGHPFPSPESLIDKALAEGTLSSSLPYVKREMLILLTANYSSREAALKAVELIKERYVAAYPEVAASQPAAIDQATQLAKDLVSQLVFEEPGVTWRSFPDDVGHKDFPGCFRCHDGKHLSASGESIRLHCNICHSVPVTVSGAGRSPVMPVATIEEPETHRETNFIANHRFQASESCVTCHGDLKFGSDDSSFCANSACHGRVWPEVELDAAFPHPIALEGKHAEVWCHDCHKGVEKPEYKCSNCHLPPMDPHFGGRCEDCHTPAGFDQADLGSFEHPVPLEGVHATLECSACHAAGKTLTFDCAACHQPPSTTHFGPNCKDCHTPAGFKGATLPPEMHPVPLIGAHQRATCDVCHAEGKRVPEYVCSNCHKPPESHFQGTCETCHSPDGWAESAVGLTASAPRISHSLQGRAECLLCHDPAGKVKPAPANHKDLAVEQCVLCHKTEN